MTRIIRLIGISACLVLSTACATGSEAGNWVELKGQRFTVEIAATEAERSRGLMFRDDMPADHGMIFIHDAEVPQAYWMKNTRIALDIIYFDHDRKIVSVSERVPPCSLGDQCPPFRSEGPALYVLELNAGLAGQMKLKAGDEIKFGPAVTARKP